MDKRRKGRGKRMEASMGERKEANKMRMPGFTAETSLHSTSEHYRMAGSGEALVGNGEVVPQAIGCVSRTFNLGPLSLNVRCCALPPSCCLRACAFGHCFSRCIP